MASAAAQAARRERRAVELAGRLAKQVEAIGRRSDNGDPYDYCQAGEVELSDGGSHGRGCAKLGALAVGEPTECTAHHLVDGLTPKDLEHMSVDELLALRAQLQRGGR